MKKNLVFFSALIVLLLTLFMFSSCTTKEITLKDNKGKVFAKVSSAKLEKSSEYSSYSELVINEAIGIIADINGCDEEKAEKLLFKNSYTIDTFLDREIFSSIETAYNKSDVKEIPFGCAVTNLKGGLCAVYSSESKEESNFAITGFSPYSSLKPLSVYAPAIESGKAYWSKVYEDSPYKQIMDENGELVNWPENATGTYTNSNTTVYQAIKESINTVAVKCLDDYGVNNSISFLKENFDINLDYESKKATNEDEDEVIGNLAMGYLYDGVSVIDMAGYYQIFGNGGKYYKPEAITKIIDDNGKTIYTKNNDYKQVVSEPTAFIMNELLQGVVQSGGTGAGAKMDDIEVGGKTGTGIANDCHWFVGFVPQYSCAVWHGGSLVDNYSPQIFKSIMQALKLDESVKYPKCREIKQAIYCADSGLLCNENCKRVDMGYYFADEIIKKCKIHQ